MTEGIACSAQPRATDEGFKVRGSESDVCHRLQEVLFGALSSPHCSRAVAYRQPGPSAFAVSSDRLLVSHISLLRFSIVYRETRQPHGLEALERNVTHARS